MEDRGPQTTWAAHRNTIPENAFASLVDTDTHTLIDTAGWGCNWVETGLG